MKFHSLSGNIFWKAAAAALITALLTAGISIFLIRAGVSPFPAPPSLVFASLFFENPSMVIGFLFHFTYILVWTLLFVSLFREKMSFWRAAFVGGVTYVLSLVLFFPVIGWGFLGLEQSPQFIVAALVPHVLFTFFLWGSCKVFFRSHHYHDQPSAFDEKDDQRPKI